MPGSRCCLVGGMFISGVAILSAPRPELHESRRNMPPTADGAATLRRPELTSSPPSSATTWYCLLFTPCSPCAALSRLAASATDVLDECSVSEVACRLRVMTIDFVANVSSNPGLGIESVGTAWEGGRGSAGREVERGRTGVDK